MSFLSWPYVEGTSVWGENTSAYDFCEMNYYITNYIAEFVNVSTNLGYIYLGYKGIRNNRRGNNDAVVTTCYMLLQSIGVGSGIYHAAPKYFTQMVDEFPMLYATAGILYGTLSITLGASARKSLAILMPFFITGVSIAHACLGNVTLFRMTFLSLILSVLGWLTYLVNFRVPDAKVRKDAACLTGYGAGFFLLGYVLWNVDMHLCSYLTGVRQMVGMPLGFLIEFHGWWHIFTGIAVYYDIVFIEYLRLYMTSRNTKSPRNFKLIWSNRYTLPHMQIDQKPVLKKS
ncbi:ceramidase [Calycina marina]|uniref:Ceramidase n=1 Tax=Calycina marina TaxID=1763456 RepID=A0A9P7YXV6_9HELO|nr:ceramidase [Calycina marina]